MAKVTMPLLSASARGKIADAIVFFPWKGLAIVRQWLVPANPQSIDQMTARAKLKGIGKAIDKIKRPFDIAGGSVIYQRALAVTPSGQPWNSYFAKKVLDHIKETTNWSAFTTDYSASPNKTDFENEATTLGLVNFAFTKGYTEEIPAGLQLYMAAYAAYAQGLTEYDTDPTGWASTLVTAFAADFTATT